MDILQYESKIWATADLLRGCGIKESEWPSFMMPFFALTMIESRLIRMLEEEINEIGEEALADINKEDLYEMIKDKGQGYNKYIFEQNKTLGDICKNDKSFAIDFDAYLNGFDGETKDLLGVEASEGEKFLDIKGVITKLNAKKVLLGYTKLWAEIDLKPYNNSEITTLEEHIKRKWADISAETAGEQYTPDDVIALISEIIASKIEESDKLLKIYDCTCGGGNLLFGVEDRINQKFKRLTQTFGQDWNDALYALAKIESRFRPDSKIEHGNTLVNDKFYNEEFDVVIANPPYGVSWKGYQKDIENDKTGRFKFLPSVSDGQLLFMQHLISKLDSNGIGVVVHNGSTLFTGEAGSAESNIRKWMLDCDIVEAIIQLPTDEFFNTNIYTYLWIINKNKKKDQIGRVMLINASEKFTLLNKSKGSKRKQIDQENRLEIVKTLTEYTNNEYAKVFDKEKFYFNKQMIVITNVDKFGKSLEESLPKGKKSIKITPTKIIYEQSEITQFIINTFDSELHSSLEDRYEKDIKPFIDSIDNKNNSLRIITENSEYWFDNDNYTIAKERKGKCEMLGYGKISIKASLKKATKSQGERIEIIVEILPDYEKDYEIIPFSKDEIENQKLIEEFMLKYITRPYVLLENSIGVEVNFNKIFFKLQPQRSLLDIINEIKELEGKLQAMEERFI
ncbi:N-6 DNA methylase [Clostridium sp. C8-1-8]|uniref:HsdM family class I SAM-dependent methyltransferase n=1 Tax=Clostridium sp. C8-1-8 TaxID=2698831 RepID=UPI00136D58FB|nr:N-6 DNA methylase [Clostridium sp. C8-1-8]